jgi:superfamily II DNA or RNA helicase
MRVVFDIGNVTTVAQGDPATIASLRGMLSFRARVGRAKTSTLCMGISPPGLNPTTVRFGTGLLGIVKRVWAEALHVELIIHDRRTIPLIPPERYNTAWLRDYQQEALAATQVHARGLINHPTGTGKGEIVAALYAQRPVPTLIIVPNEPLLAQIARTFRSRVGVEAAIYGGGFHNISNLTVCTYQALNAATRFPWERFHQVIFDEAHGAASATCCATLNKLTNAYWRYGLGATNLLRADQKHYYVIAAFGPVIHQIKFSEAVTTLKAIAQPKLIYLPYRHTHTPGSASNWVELYKNMIVRNAARNAAAVAAAASAPRPCMVFTQSVDHAGAIAAALSQRGLRVALATGQTRATNKQALEQTARKELDILVCTDVFKQGVDVPAVASMMNLAGGKAPIPVIQKVGRAARRYASDGAEIKSEFPVFDMADMGCGNGQCSHADCFMLVSHFNERVSHYGKLR